MKRKIASVFALILIGLWTPAFVYADPPQANPNYKAAVDAENAKQAAVPSSSSSNLPVILTKEFRLNPATFSPSTKTYTSGSGNIANLIGDIVRIMLIAISTLAVISIAIGGVMMAISGGNTDRVSKGKAILTHSLQALAVALSSYFIIKFVSWVIG